MPKDAMARQQFEQKLAALVEKFERNHNDYMRADYSETDARVALIDPLFEALGWEMRDEKRRDVGAREVIREKKEHSGRSDYRFRVEGRTLFFVEAKAPHALLDNNAVLQAKKYAWSEPDPRNIVYFVVLTNFREFYLYDASRKPDPNQPLKGHVFELSYKQYLTPSGLENLWMLSRAAVPASLDKLLTPAQRAARERTPLDQRFLNDLTTWREQLAKAVFKEHSDLTSPDLNRVVQTFLDRLIFIRVAEDRGVLPQGELVKIARDWRREGRARPIAADLIPLFREVNDKLNGEIFKSREVEDINWDSELVAKIIEQDLEPYDFARIPVELLGSIYERYLGKIIHIKGKRVEVKDKPEVRKAGGVYYTPKYIVDYIIEQTVGKLIEGKTPKQIEKLRILDPACGSGSFLLGAYQKLLDYHKQYNLKHARACSANDAQARFIEEEEGGEFKLPLDVKAAILRNNIFGVDIDPQAVEITMMSLYVKMLEGEHGAIAEQAVLPRLRDNIKCGNSLIGYDIGDLSDEDKARINPFDWNSKGEGFGEIMGAGGFDAVIGNPPYVRGRSLNLSTKEYLLRTLPAFTANADLYIAFLERGFALLRNDGMMSFIIPRSYVNESYAEKSRRHFLEFARIVEVVDLQGIKVFQDATVTNAVLVLQKDAPLKTIAVRHWNQANPNLLATQQVLDTVSALIRPEMSGARQAFITKMNQPAIPLNDLCYVSYSVAAHSEVEKKTKDAYIFDRKKNSKCKRFIEAREISRYEIVYTGRWLEYDPKIVRRPGLPELFDAPKIMVRDVVGQGGLICALDDTGLYADYSVVCLTLKSNLRQVTSRKLVWTSQEIELAEKYSLRYLLGIINSSLLNFFFKTAISGGLHVYPDNLRQLPIRAINFSDATDKSRHDKMVALVERMLDLHAQKQAAKSDATRERIEREINVTDEQIDALVYKLYALTDEEIKVVEGQ